MTEKHDSEQLFRSLTGFEELMIRNLFGRAATLLAKDAADGDTFPLMRALLTVVERRGGAQPQDAYGLVMAMTAEAVADSFADEPAEAPGEA